MTESPFGIPAYYVVFGRRRYKTFCNAQDAERYLELGDEQAPDSFFSHHASVGLAPEAGRVYEFEGHEGCLEDDCGCQCHASEDADV